LEVVLEREEEVMAEDRAVEILLESMEEEVQD